MGHRGFGDNPISSCLPLKYICVPAYAIIKPLSVHSSRGGAENIISRSLQSDFSEFLMFLFAATPPAVFAFSDGQPVDGFMGAKTESEVEKFFEALIKKFSKNNKYFISAKDLALADSLIKDGFSLPANFKYDELSKKYEVPDNLLKLIDNEEKAFLTLKIVEIIGEDEIYQLDPETIYFVTNLLNKMSLYTIRNKVIVSALPERA